MKDVIYTLQDKHTYSHVAGSHVIGVMGSRVKEKQPVSSELSRQSVVPSQRRVALIH